MPHPHLLSCEKYLAASHKMLHHAHAAACQIDLEGTAEDIWQLLLEVERVQSALLRGNRRRVLKEIEQLPMHVSQSRLPRKR